MENIEGSISFEEFFPDAEIAAAMGKPQVSRQARLMSRAMRELAAVAAQSRTIVVFINQIRDDRGYPVGSEDDAHRRAGPQALSLPEA